MADNVGWFRDLIDDTMDELAQATNPETIRQLKKDLQNYKDQLAEAERNDARDRENAESHFGGSRRKRKSKKSKKSKRSRRGKKQIKKTKKYKKRSNKKRSNKKRSNKKKL